MKILILGDIIGKPGRTVLTEKLAKIQDSFRIDFTIANCENAAGGFGITADVGQKIFSSGVDILTSGNHIWDKKDSIRYIAEEKRILRPANYPPGTPGRGSAIFETSSGKKIGVINISGRTFMDALDCPFRAAEKSVAELEEETDTIIVDIHAEATSEKVAMGWYLDGKVGAVVGTHTHVQTADERVLPKGTAYITDLGMTGPVNSVIGVKKEHALYRFQTRMPKKFAVADGIRQLEGVVVEIEESSQKARSISRVQVKD
ncbi:MAG: TIGR00282 family metallophosphoesterase [Nitrospinota bacterium]